MASFDNSSSSSTTATTPIISTFNNPQEYTPEYCYKILRVLTAIHK